MVIAPKELHIGTNAFTFFLVSASPTYELDRQFILGDLFSLEKIWYLSFIDSILFIIQTLMILAKPKSAILTVLFSPTRTFRAARSKIKYR
jgi:hypothetical protein